MTDATISRQFAARLLDEQPQISPSQAAELTSTILDGPAEIAEAAAEWALTGEMPSTPTIEGHSPHSLGQRLFPSQAFTTLIALTQDPVRTLEALKHLPGRGARGSRRESMRR